MRRASLLCLCLASAAALGGCGRKTAVKPPQLVAPEAIRRLEAHNESAGIRLRWERPRDYVDGSSMDDLAAFAIERRSPGGEFQLLERVEVEDRYRFQQVRHFRYLDTGVEEGGTYAYRVYSFTLDGSRSEPSNVVEIARAAPSPTPAAPEP